MSLWLWLWLSRSRSPWRSPWPWLSPSVKVTLPVLGLAFLVPGSLRSGKFGLAPLHQYHRLLLLLPRWYRLCQSRRRDSATPRAS